MDSLINRINSSIISFLVVFLLLFLNKGVVMARGPELVKEQGGIKEYKLDNGLKLLLKPKADATMISSQIWYKVGSRNEETGLTGLAHYLEHIMFKGTKQFAKGEIAQIIELNGGIFNAFTSDDYTAYFENFAPENLELALKIESDRMKNSRIDAAEVDLERSVIISELEGRDNDPQSTLYKNLKATAYNVHPYANPIIGWDEDLQNIKADDLRKFYEIYYQPNNAVLILAGNFDENIALSLVDKYFGKIKSEIKEPRAISQEPEQKAFKQVVIKQEGYMKLFAMAFHIPEFAHKDSAALHVLADIGFGGMSSRMYKKLVDSGLALRVSGQAEASIDPGLFRVIAVLQPDADINEVQKIIEAELEQMKSNITEAELEKAKARVEASAVYEADGVYEEALQIGYFEAISNDWTNYVTWVDQIKAVSLEDLSRVAKSYLRKNSQTVVHYLPEAADEKLAVFAEPEKTAALPYLPNFAGMADKQIFAYGANTVEPMDSAQMQRLLKLSKPRYAKKYFDEKHEKPLSFDVQEFKLYDKSEDSKANPNVLFKEDHALPLIYLNAVVYAGAINELESKKYGLAKVTAEMLERGTKNKDRFKIAELLDIYGGDIDIAVTKEYAQISVSSLTKNWQKTLDLLNEILKEPAFNEEELNKLKAEMIAKIKQENEYPARLAQRKLSQLIYPAEHPFHAHDPETRVKALESITIKDVKDFYAKYYSHANLEISVVGDTNKEMITTTVAPIFKEWNILGVSKLNKPQIETVAINSPREHVTEMANKEQNEIFLGHASELSRTHEDFYSLLLANYTLGARPLSSKLGVVVRDEHGFAYNVRSSFAASLGAGPFTISLGTNPKNARKAIELTKETVAKFIKEGIAETDLEANKKFLTGSFAVRNLSSNEDIADVLSGIQIYGLGKEYISEYNSLINSVTLEQANAAAKEHIHPDKLHTSIAGPAL